MVAFSVGEEELRGIDTKPLVGNLAAWNYFESVDNPTNQTFVAAYKAYAKAHKLPNADTVVTNDPMEATYVGLHMWAQAVEKSGDNQRGQSARGNGGPVVQRAVRLYADHGCHQPPPAQAGDDW